MAHGNVYSGKQWTLAIAQESAWGTPETTGFKALHIETAQPIDRTGLQNVFRRRAHGDRMPRNTDYFRSQAGGIVMLPFEAWATHDTLDLLIHGVMHDLVSEGATTPYAKIFAVKVLVIVVNRKFLKLFSRFILHYIASFTVH